jgi:hypothetical protein
MWGRGRDAEPNQLSSVCPCPGDADIHRRAVFQLQAATTLQVAHPNRDLVFQFLALGDHLVRSLTQLAVLGLVQQRAFRLIGRIADGITGIAQAIGARGFFLFTTSAASLARAACLSRSVCVLVVSLAAVSLVVFSSRSPWLPRTGPPRYWTTPPFA